LLELICNDALWDCSASVQEFQCRYSKYLSVKRISSSLAVNKQTLTAFVRLFRNAKKDDEGLALKSEPIPVRIMGVNRKTEVILRDLHRTQPGMWFSDETVNAFIEAIIERHMSTQSSSVRVRIFKYVVLPRCPCLLLTVCGVSQFIPDGSIAQQA
jgi:Ulp1 family protease